MAADPPSFIEKPFATNTAHRVDITILTDPKTRAQADLTGKAVTVLIPDGANVRSYAVQWTGTRWDGVAYDQSKGIGWFEMNASYHGTSGEVTAQVHIDGVLKGRHVFTFETKLVETP